MLVSRWSWVFYAIGVMLLVATIVLGAPALLPVLYLGLVALVIGAILDMTHHKSPVQRQLDVVRKRAEWDRYLEAAALRARMAYMYGGTPRSIRIDLMEWNQRIGYQLDQSDIDRIIRQESEYTRQEMA